MGTIIVITVIVAVLYFFIKMAIKSANQNNEENSNDASRTNAPTSTTVRNSNNERLEKPGYACSYYELVGMKYRKLTQGDLGIFDGYAFAENDNEFDKYAVGIYRKDNNKLVAYVPKDFQGKSNKELHKIISKLGGSTPAKFRIWERNGNIYGCAYIKDE